MLKDPSSSRQLRAMEVVEDTWLQGKGESGLGPLGKLLLFVHISETLKCVKDVWLNGNLQEHIQGISVPTSPSEDPDSWCWWDNLDNNYTTRAGYSWLQEQHTKTRDREPGAIGWVVFSAEMSWFGYPGGINCHLKRTISKKSRIFSSRIEKSILRMCSKKPM
ncbi:hypothetical protein VNO78_34365 [Psophocarpus tetragonolobus]|uniref:Uncharacterized protein n=1 Tax=Psophocarpus tetragonolobus TaxID=3891 RepID=A0AAN9NV39_PSOTE